MTKAAMFSYRPVRIKGRWMIEVTDLSDGGKTLMTCGIAPTAADVLERIRMLIIDDDKIDVLKGGPRKYQS